MIQNIGAVKQFIRTGSKQRNTKIIDLGENCWGPRNRIEEIMRKKLQKAHQNRKKVKKSSYIFLPVIHPSCGAYTKMLGANGIKENNPLNVWIHLSDILVDLSR